MKLKRGFTLIELLVVIAIIGVLSAVVLASLNTARSKGNDAAIMSDLDGIRTQAQLFYGDNGNAYTGVCSNATVVKQRNGANAANGALLERCTDSGTAYAVAAELVSLAGATYCVDSLGNATTTMTAIGSIGTVCS